MYDKNLPYVRVLPSLATKHRFSVLMLFSFYIFFSASSLLLFGWFFLVFFLNLKNISHLKIRRGVDVCSQPIEANGQFFSSLFCPFVRHCRALGRRRASPVVAKRWRQRDDRQRRHLANNEK